MSDIKLGKIISGVANRDAIHIAIAPVTSDEQMFPGQHVCLVADNPAKVQSVRGAEYEKPIGIVDPFLPYRIEPGVAFWLCLYPQTITSLRHDWTHPAFSQEIADISASKEWLSKKAERVGVPVESMISVLLRNEYRGGFGEEIDGEREIEPELWKHLKNVTGQEVPEKERPQWFHCAC